LHCHCHSATTSPWNPNHDNTYKSCPSSTAPPTLKCGPCKISQTSLARTMTPDPPHSLLPTPYSSSLLLLVPKVTQTNLASLAMALAGLQIWLFFSPHRRAEQDQIRKIALDRTRERSNLQSPPSCGIFTNAQS
jgi:hypothetical protein